MRTDLTLSQIVLDHPAAVSVFEKYNLDYCCRGKDTLENACRDKGLSINELSREITAAENSGVNVGSKVDLATLDVKDLIKYILETHHRYVIESCPLIDAHLIKVCEKHGDRHPELHQVLSVFRELKDELIFHMYKEENVLFPRMLEVMKAAEPGSIHPVPDPRYIATPIGAMEMEHEKAGEFLELLHKLTNGYTPPADACTTYKLVYRELADFARDLHLHVHSENNLLFPRIIEVQRKITQVQGH